MTGNSRRLINSAMLAEATEAQRNPRNLVKAAQELTKVVTNTITANARISKAVSQFEVVQGKTDRKNVSDVHSQFNQLLTDLYRLNRDNKQQLKDRMSNRVDTAAAPAFRSPRPGSRN